jgi:hypothetical protein
MDEKRELLRHTLATVAYRAERTLEGTSNEFASFDGAGRLPVQILAHMSDVLDWGLSIAAGQEKWQSGEPQAWDREQERFFNSLRAFDGFLASDAELHGSVERLMQGPVADVLTHVGQLAMLRRMWGKPTRRENFYIAEVAVGQVTMEQPEPVRAKK